MTRETADDGAHDDVDDALAHAAQRHPQDSTAFADLYRRHLPGVYRYCLVRLGHVQQAEDVTAETFWLRSSTFAVITALVDSTRGCLESRGTRSSTTCRASG